MTSLLREVWPFHTKIWTPSTVPLAVALTLICAIASWRLIEAPLIKAGHKFKYGKGAQPIV
jgi:predicted acyltransferase